jgi:hypothetical protein
MNDTKALAKIAPRFLHRFPLRQIAEPTTAKNVLIAE